ncbi:MAG: peptidylprolyl isomerase [Candidatus Limnocylindrales bacterium]
MTFRQRHAAPRATGRLAVVAVIALAVVLAACEATGASFAPGGSATGGSGEGGSGSGGTGCPSAQPAPLAAGETRTVTISTDLGDIAMKVEADLSPIAVGNFVALAACGYYDGVVFHRVVPGFVIQAGDGENGRGPNVDSSRVGTGGPGYTIADEPVTATYRRGTLAMARSSRPDSQGSQFFIVLDDSAKLSLADANTYAILGEVTVGMEVADAIAAAADQEIPTDPVVMTTVEVANP